jgi:hypothetical protein
MMFECIAKAHVLAVFQDYKDHITEVVRKGVKNIQNEHL